MRFKSIRCLALTSVGFLALTILPCFIPILQPWIQAQAVEVSEMPQKVTVLGQVLDLKHTDGGGIGQPFVAEYVPSSETLYTWTLMYAVRFLPTSIEPKAYAEMLLQKLKARGPADGVVNSTLFEADDKSSVSLDFLIKHGKDFEHNVWRYFSCGGNLLALQIARRIYGTETNQQEATAVVDSVDAKRPEIWKEIARKDLPYRCH